MKLSDEKKAHVLEAALVSKFGVRITAYMNRVVDLVEDSVQEMYPLTMQAWIKTAPVGALYETDSFEVHTLLKKNSHGGVEKQWSIGMDNFVCKLCHTRTVVYRRVTTPKSYKLLACDTNYGHTAPLTIPKKYHPRMKRLSVSYELLKKDVYATSSVLKQALSASNTDTILKKEYPELAAFLPQVEKQTKALAITREVVAAALKPTRR